MIPFGWLQGSQFVPAKLEQYQTADYGPSPSSVWLSALSGNETLLRNNVQMSLFLVSLGRFLSIASCFDLSPRNSLAGVTFP